jgi:hypothetical protein
MKPTGWNKGTEKPTSVSLEGIVYERDYNIPSGSTLFCKFKNDFW